MSEANHGPLGNRLYRQPVPENRAVGKLIAFNVLLIGGLLAVNFPLQSLVAASVIGGSYAVAAMAQSPISSVCHRLSEFLQRYRRVTLSDLQGNERPREERRHSNRFSD